MCARCYHALGRKTYTRDDVYQVDDVTGEVERIAVCKACHDDWVRCGSKGAFYDSFLKAVRDDLVKVGDRYFLKGFVAETPAEEPEEETVEVVDLSNLKPETDNL